MQSLDDVGPLGEAGRSWEQRGVAGKSSILSQNQKWGEAGRSGEAAASWPGPNCNNLHRFHWIHSHLCFFYGFWLKFAWFLWFWAILSEIWRKRPIWQNFQRLKVAGETRPFLNPNCSARPLTSKLPKCNVVWGPGFLEAQPISNSLSWVLSESTL